MAPINPPSAAEFGDLPDMSHLSPEEQALIMEVIKKQHAEERQEHEEQKRAEMELQDLDRQIDERKENALRLLGTQDDAICQICQKTKFADGIGHKCIYCQLRSCARCGGRTKSKDKVIWACTPCQKRQQLLARTGKWFQQNPPTPVKMNAQHMNDYKNETHSIPTSVSREFGKQPETTTMAGQKLSPTAPGTGFERTQPSIANSTDAAVVSQKRTPNSRRQNSLKKQSSIEIQPHPSSEPTIMVNGSSSPPKAYHQQHSSSKSANSTNHQRQQQTPTTAMHDPKSRERPKETSKNVEQRHKFDQQPQSSRSIQQTSLSENRLINSNNVSSQQQRHHDEQRMTMANGAIVSSDGVPVQVHSQKDIPAVSVTSAIVEQISIPRAVPNSAESNGPLNSTVTADYVVENHQQRFPTNKQRPEKRRDKPQPRRQFSSSEDEQQQLQLKRPSHQAWNANNAQIMQDQDQIGALPSIDSLQEQESPYTHQQQPQDQDFSEKDLLRYIYDNKKLSISSTSNGGTNLRKNAEAPLLTSASSPLTATGTALLDNQQQQQHQVGRRHIQTFPSGPPSTSFATIMAGNSTIGNEITTSANKNNAFSPVFPRIRSNINPPNSVTWKVSADQQQLVGHVVLNRHSGITSASLDALASISDGFGLKVTAGRNATSGNIGAFISRIKLGSVADTVGQLRTGDEIYLWNGTCMENLTPEAMYNIVQSTKNDQLLELIVSRPIYDKSQQHPGALPTNEVFTHQNNGVGIPHSQSLIGGAGSSVIRQPRMFRQQQHQQQFANRADTPLVFHRTNYRVFPVDYQPMDSVPVYESGFADLGTSIEFPPHNGNIQLCGRVEVALLYLPQKRELVVSLEQAIDLLPRPDGSSRNPYAKIFLLPNRSEKSQRQSKILVETLCPVWKEYFYYENLSETSLVNRVLEITVWDHDFADESNNFLGEVLIELSTTVLNNQPFLYPLIDMDEENPIRTRLRQRRFSSLTPPTSARSHSYSNHYAVPSLIYRQVPEEECGDFVNDSHYTEQIPSKHRSRHVRTYHDDDFVSQNMSERPTRNEHLPNGYVSDWDYEARDPEFYNERYYTGERYHRRQHAHRHDQREREPGRPVQNRRPKSAAAVAVYSIPEYERNAQKGRRHLPEEGYLYSAPNYNPSDEQQIPVSRGKFEQMNERSGIRKPKKMTRHQELQQEANIASAGGYGSDGSESLSVNSAQSLQNRNLNRNSMNNVDSQQQNNQQGISSSVEENDYRQSPLAGGSNYPARQMQNAREQPHFGAGDSFDPDEFDDTGQNHSGSSGSPQVGREFQQKGGIPMMVGAGKDRRKGLMTRLIPGRTAPNELFKRTGFARSEEVGIPGGGGGLSIPEQNPLFIKQGSKESNDSSDSNMPILTDRPLDDFVKGLGPGQIVGRQAVASQRMGDLKVGISLGQNNDIQVQVCEAKNLNVHQRRILPGIYVKVYLLENKNCLSKGKTHPVKSDGSTVLIKDTIIFTENPKHKMLQMVVLADNGRFERRSLLGVAQVSLDRLQLRPEKGQQQQQQQQIDWYKLYTMDSLTGSGNGADTGDERRRVGPFAQNSNDSMG